MILNRSCRE